MHAAVFEARWSSEELMVKHRALVAADHRGGGGREIIALDWTLSHHERGTQNSTREVVVRIVEARASSFSASTPFPISRSRAAKFSKTFATSGCSAPSAFSLMTRARW